MAMIEQELPNPSALGTREYWDKTYEREITNQTNTPLDEGTVWFSDADAEEKVVIFLAGLSGHLDDQELSDEGIELLDGPILMGYDDASILDIGTGNGHMLFSLREAGWNGRMVGVDYSFASVVLAQQIAVTRKKQDQINLLSRVDTINDTNIVDHKLRGTESEIARVVIIPPVVRSDTTFHQWDILSSAPDLGWFFKSKGQKELGFDIVHDKGTFDAISLSSETTIVGGHRICSLYPSRLAALVRPGGIFVITSCNWTETELINWFEHDSSSSTIRLELVARMKYPVFSYGGSKGQQVTTVCFKRKC